MKDRIKKVMESQHMTQQTFANFIEMSPASLSSIFNGRTKPTLNIVEAIKKKIPAISTDWLMFGFEPMYLTDASAKDVSETVADASVKEQMLGLDVQPTAPSAYTAPEQAAKSMVKIIDKPQRKITEIRIFYDDQTWETFVPKK